MEKILILDFGSQYTQLIARKIRECGVYSEIKPYSISENEFNEIEPTGIIISGGPSSIYSDDAPLLTFDIFSKGIPLLGICYGLQHIAYSLGGSVDKAAYREYGKAELIIDKSDDLFKDVSSQTSVWMSHGDLLTRLPDGFEIIAHSDNSPICSIRNKERRIYGVQFHPEVHHTPEGKKILNNFVRNICGCKDIWNAREFIDSSIKNIRKKIGKDNVILALSGGVDSIVAAVLLHRAIGKQLICVHIDSGLMRKNESKKVSDLFKKSFKIPIKIINQTELFLKHLKNVSNPERKRKIIGKTFIEIFQQYANTQKDIKWFAQDTLFDPPQQPIEKLSFSAEGSLFEKYPQTMIKIKWLAQGTLYPDVIESLSIKGPSATIKTHHNVGGLPKKMKLEVIEPFRELFKDEVRAIGRELGVPERYIGRHPFPGPGLAIRILGKITKERLEILRQADDIFLEEISNTGLYDEIWQAFAVLLPVQSVGVMGDERTYENVCALRAVTSTDGMTADWYVFPPEVLGKISNRIINEVRGINRVVYDITSKPPGTIEWE